MKRLFAYLLITLISALAVAQQPGVGNVGGELQPYDPARLGKFVIKPKQIKLELGQSIQLTVETFDDKGELMSNPPLSWLPSALYPPPCVRVEQGLVTAIRVGTCGVNAVTFNMAHAESAVVVTVVKRSPPTKKRRR